MGTTQARPVRRTGGKLQAREDATGIRRSLRGTNSSCGDSQAPICSGVKFDGDYTDGRGTWQVPIACVFGLLTTLFVPMITPRCPAQVIRGIVVEAESRLPVPGATVELRRAGDRNALQTTTDSVGLFILDAGRSGTYAIQARRLGFLAAPPDTIRLGRGEALSLEIRLGARAVPLEPVVVTVRGDEWLNEFERRRAGAFGRFLDREEIEARSAMHTTDLLRTMPGLSFVNRRGGPGAQLYMRRPGGMCVPAIWIDGLQVPLASTGLTIDDVLPPGVIEGIEIYNSVSAAPTQFRTGDCGVVLFWTRRGARPAEGGVNWTKIAVGAGASVLFILLVFR